MASKNLNMMTPYRQKPEEKTSSRTRRAVILALLMLVLVFVAVFAKITLDNMTLQGELDDLDAYISDPGNVADYNESLQLAAYVQILTVREQSIGQAKNCIDSYPRITSYVLSDILRCTNRYYESTPYINSYNATSGELNFDTYASVVTQTAEYVASLEDSAFFSSVEYRGYEYSALFDAFRINVECILSESPGKQ